MRTIRYISISQYVSLFRHHFYPSKVANRPPNAVIIFTNHFDLADTSALFDFALSRSTTDISSQLILDFPTLNVLAFYFIIIIIFFWQLGPEF